METASIFRFAAGGVFSSESGLTRRGGVLIICDLGDYSLRTTANSVACALWGPTAQKRKGKSEKAEFYVVFQVIAQTLSNENV